MKLEDIMKMKQQIENSINSIKNVYENADKFRLYLNDELLEKFKTSLKTTIGNIISTANIFDYVILCMFGCEVIPEEISKEIGSEVFK